MGTKIFETEKNLIKQSCGKFFGRFCPGSLTGSSKASKGPADGPSEVSTQVAILKEVRDVGSSIIKDVLQVLFASCGPSKLATDPSSTGGILTNSSTPEARQARKSMAAFMHEAIAASLDLKIDSQEARKLKPTSMNLFVSMLRATLRDLLKVSEAESGPFDLEGICGVLLDESESITNLPYSDSEYPSRAEKIKVFAQKLMETAPGCNLASKVPDLTLNAQNVLEFKNQALVGEAERDTVFQALTDMKPKLETHFQEKYFPLGPETKDLESQTKNLKLKRAAKLLTKNRVLGGSLLEP